MVKYDLGCGKNKQEGFIGVDIKKMEGVDIVYNLERFPWDFAEDESADEIVVSHYIEHTKDLIKFMNELYRIMKKGAKCTIIAPYYSSIRCWQDPTHVRAISEATFLYYNEEWRKKNNLEYYPIRCDFDFSYGYHLDPEWISRSEEAKAFAIKHYINVVADIQVTLIKR